MAFRREKFRPGHYYHLFNRGVEKRPIFSNPSDYSRFLDTLLRFQFRDLKTQNGKRGSLLAWCLMPNHYHCLVKEEMDGGVSNWFRLVGNSYTRYFNTRYPRVGALFQGAFKAVWVETNEQLLHVSRYIHLNPYVAGFIPNVEGYEWSSYGEYLRSTPSQILDPGIILDQFSPEQSYQAFVTDFAEYARSIEQDKKLYIDL